MAIINKLNATWNKSVENKLLVNISNTLVNRKDNLYKFLKALIYVSFKIPLTTGEITDSFL